MFVVSVVAQPACAGSEIVLDEADLEPSPTPYREPTPAISGPCSIEPDDELTFELPTWNLEVSQSNWDALHEDVHADVDVGAALCVEGVRYAIELELQGSSTRGLAKKSFDLKWKHDQPLRSWPYDGDPDSGPVEIRKLFLKGMGKDQSMIREALGFDLYRALGYATPHTGFVNLRINGVYWGLYATIEPVNEAFLAARGYPEGGRLYKAVRKHGSRADFAPGRDLTRAFETEIMQKGDEHDAAPLPDEYAALERFVNILQTTPLEEAEFDIQIDPIFSLEAYFDRMVWVAFTRNGDAVAQNFYLYHSVERESERWYQLPWDSDISLGADYRDVEAVVDATIRPLVDGGNHFSRRMLMIAGLRSRYIDRFLEVLDEHLFETEGLTRLGSYRERLTNDLTHDQTRWNRSTDAQTAFDRIEAFISERGPVLREALSALYSGGRLD
jgi:spore coat protein CotH